MNVLLVEDDLDQATKVANRVQRHLGKDTNVLGPYSEFSSVLTIVKEQKFHLALIDIQLKNDLYAGINIAETIQQFHPVPILFISGVTEKEVVERADQVHSSDFLQKPYDEQSFFRALDYTLQRVDLSRSGSLKRVFRPRNKDRYWIKSDRSVYEKVDPRHIVCVEALDHHCRFYIRNEKPIITSAKLKQEVFENGLGPLGSFYLLNRSTIINLDEVDRIEGNQVIMKELKPLNKKSLLVPKERRKELFDQLGIPLD